MLVVVVVVVVGVAFLLLLFLLLLFLLLLFLLLFEVANTMMIRHQLTRTIISYNGPDHRGFSLHGLPSHKMARITSGCGAMRYSITQMALVALGFRPCRWPSRSSSAGRTPTTARRSSAARASSRFWSPSPCRSGSARGSVKTLNPKP